MRAVGAREELDDEAARQDLFQSTGEGRIAFRRRTVAYSHPRYWSAFAQIGSFDRSL